MRIQWFGVFLVLCATASADAQQWSGGYNPQYYYGSQYYRAPQTFTPRYYPNYQQYYYYPYYYQSTSSGNYPTTPSYSAAPATSTSRPARSTAGRSGLPSVPASASTIHQLPGSPAPAETIITVEPQVSRIPEVVQEDRLVLPTSPPAKDREPGNIEIFLEKLVAAMTPVPNSDDRPRADKIWISGSYQGSFFRPMRLAGPIVSTGSQLDTHPGALGQPSTRVLFGNDPVDFNLASGFSLAAGFALDNAGTYSIDVGGFAVFPSRQSVTFASDGFGNPLITRPVFALDEGRPGSFAVAVTGISAGTTQLDFSSHLSAVELNGRKHCLLGASGRCDFLFGVRYARLAERMTVRDSYTDISGGGLLFNGLFVDSVIREDSFAASNHFIGPQLGARIACDSRWINISGFAKLGLGATIQNVNIEGASAAMSVAGRETAQGGILALSSNSGNHTRTMFGLLPEIGFNVGFNITEHIRAHAGYSFFLLSGAVRPGMQYDTSVNSSLAPTAVNYGTLIGQVGPNFRFVQETFWTHSLNLGVSIIY